MSETHQSQLPEFEEPPVVEVVCGVLFEPLKAMLASHIGLLWERLRKDYPMSKEVAPLTPVVERFGGEATVHLEFTDVPPLPRIWFLRQDETSLVQLQRDRFLHNWKKVHPTDEYPRYHTVIQQFKDRLAEFKGFIQDNELGVLKPMQYELTYVNHIPRGDKISTLADIGRVFPDFAWQARPGRFLSHPNGINWRTITDLPDEKGRLHTSARTATRTDGQSILQFELTARGYPGDASPDAMLAWFDLGHEWIVRGFTDLTGEEFHRDVWRRKR
ncbi:MAG: TIGR04255 family protein [Planctomycetota bacterium]